MDYNSKWLVRKSTPFANPQDIEIDFGEVEVGVTQIKSIKIVNQCTKYQSYNVVRDSISNPLDNVFKTLEYTWSLQPQEFCVCDITFRPILPNRKYTDYFFITDTLACCYKIVLQGTSIGPNVTSSETRLIMANDSIHNRTQKCVKLKNSGFVTAKFAFDTDNDQCPFKINEVSGVIKPSSKKCIAFAFESSKPGIYKCNMTCLIANQNPITFELYGICADDNSQPDFRETFQAMINDIEPPDIFENFQNYMSDSTRAVKTEPPSISLYCNCIDFGESEISYDNVGKRITQSVSMTNHRNYNVLVLWEKDISNTFSIRPLKAKLRGHQSVIFEVRFDPLIEDTLYSRVLTARIFRLPCCPTDCPTEDLTMTIIPQFVTLRLIGMGARHSSSIKSARDPSIEAPKSSRGCFCECKGHTCCQGFNDWLPQYKIPETVIMPACIPASPVYMTFAIKSFSQQPFMFSFIPPDKTHYCVKPMAGIITSNQEHQIIAVQLFPEATESQAYVERWTIRLNGNPENEIYVDFHGFAEHARLLFGDEDLVSFDPVHVGCRQTRAVPVRNATRHSVQFEYLPCTFPAELQIDPMIGVIHPNETVFHNWIFTPNQLKTYDFTISCCVSAEIGGKKSVIDIDASVLSTKGSVMAMPDELSFGELLYNESSEMEFKIFNFSSVTIHFLLICRPTKSFEIMKNPEKDIEITPINGSIEPGMKKRIQVTMKPKLPGFYELTIEYITRPNADDLTPLNGPKTLCNVSCLCYLPTIQIRDLLYLAETNKHINKMFLWNSLCIDNFNAVLRDLLPYQETCVEITVPINKFDKDEKFTIKLLLENIKPVKTTWFIKKKKSCLCEEKNVRKHLTLPRCSKDACLYCVHDQSCAIYPSKITLKPQENDVLTIEIKNIALHPAGIFWKLNIDIERIVTLNIKFGRSIILSGPSLNFKDLHIGQFPCNHYQAIWLYNNSEKASTYSINTAPLAQVNKKNYGVIFSCLNPVGCIECLSRKPVLFSFCPNKFGNFKATVSVKVGDEETTMYITATSSCSEKQVGLYKKTCPLEDIFTVPEIIAYLNTNCIVLPPQPTHAIVSKYVVLHNHHKQDVIHYQWNNYDIPGFVKISVKPLSGLIQPQSMLSFEIEVAIGSHDCSLTVDLYCDIFNASEKRRAEKEKINHCEAVKQLTGHFTITQKGISYPEEPVLQTIIPSTICRTLSVKINVYDVQNIDKKVTVMEQLSFLPLREVWQRQAICEDKFSLNIGTYSNHIFECMIWDILNNKSFEKILKENLSTPHKYNYSQVPVDLLRRKHETQRCNWMVPKENVKDILKYITSMIVHEELNFTTDHFPMLPDSRQISHRKAYSEFNKLMVFGDGSEGYKCQNV